MAFRLDYPDAGSPTSSWVPSKNPFIPGGTRPESDGVVRLPSGDPLVTHRFKMGRQADGWVFTFRGTATDRTNLRTFTAAVEGHAFVMTDPKDASTHTVVFRDYEREWALVDSAAGIWEVTLVFDESDAD